MDRKYAALCIVLDNADPFTCIDVGPRETTGQDVERKAHHTGAGIVSEKHKIWVVVFDADPFHAQVLAEVCSKPAKTETSAVSRERKTAYIWDRKATVNKGGTVTFSDLPLSPVYVVAFYDKSGDYERHIDPALGSPRGACGEPDKPDPVKLEEGKAVKVVVTIDDTSKIGG
jgi:hypothetical protein